jgi:hypothetical protein
MEWSIVSNKTGAGHWFEWREDGGFGITIGFANAEWQRVRSCPVTVLEEPFGKVQRQ